MFLPFIECLVATKTLSYLTNKIMNNKLVTSTNKLKERRNSCNKAKIGSILKQYITSEFEFNWYMQHLSVEQLIEFFQIDISKLDLD